MPGKPKPPKAAEIRRLRERLELTQAAAAELVYSALRSWQNWEAGTVAMHPAIWAWFRHQVEATSLRPKGQRVSKTS